MNALNEASIEKNEKKTSHPKLRSHKRTLQVLLLACVFVVGLGIGAATGSAQKGTSVSQSFFSSSSADFDQFWDVWNTIKKEYVHQPVDEQKLLQGAIAGMVSGLEDPYSLYFEPVQAKEFINEIQGEFEGIGAEVGIKKEKIVIITPIPGSPAEKAGILAGDVIVAIDGIDANAFTLNSAVQAIRGEKGTEVKLMIQRGEEKPQEIAVTRDTIHVRNVTTKEILQNEKRIIHITISQFNDDTLKEIQPVLAQIALQRPNGILIDLRNNPGGYLETAVDATGYFVGRDAPVVYEKTSSNKEVPYLPKTNAVLGDIPTVVLVNAGSASASEIMAGALQDYKKATILGTTTFGKGTVQSIIREFDDGSLLKLTIAQWLTPNKRVIEKSGIVPDFYVDRTADDFSNDRDPQLDAGVLFFTDHQKFVETIHPPTDEQKKSPQQ